MQKLIETGAAAEPRYGLPKEAKLLRWDDVEPAVPSSTVIACVDRSGMDLRVVAHAQAVAQRLHADLILAQVLEPANHIEGPQDPVSWGIKRHRCHERFEWIARQRAFRAKPEQVLLEGRAADELASWVAERNATFLAVATHGEGRAPGTGLGSTAQRLLEIAPSSLLLVPPTASETPAYERILVPLDGSCRAESVLPAVVTIARNDGADVLVAHVVPLPQFTQIGPLEPEAIALRDNVLQRNERVARTYLDRILRYLRSSGVDARSIIVQGDAREQVHHISLDEGAELIVLATHGQSGRADMACGSIVSYLAGHAPAPLLILRNDEDRSALGTGAMQQEPYSTPYRQ